MINHGLKVRRGRAVGVVTFTVDVDADFDMEALRTGEPAWDLIVRAKGAIVEEAKRKVAMGNCSAKIEALSVDYPTDVIGTTTKDFAPLSSEVERPS